MLSVKNIIKKIISKENLTKKEIFYFIDQVADNKITPAQIGAFLAALATKKETADEIYFLSRYIYENALKIGPFEKALDIHGTGGDGSGSFNISSTTIFVAAAGDVIIAKHGNRSSSGRSGSADVLEALGVNINLKPEQVNKCIDKIGIGFMFAQKFHPKLKNITEPRKEIGIKTIFNKSFPLVSPANVKNHFLGITDWDLAPLFAEVLKKQGCERFMLIHGQDPMDEVSLSSPTNIWQYFKGEEKKYTIRPEDFGLKSCFLSEVKGDNPKLNANITKNILSGNEIGPKREIILLNSAASFLIADRVDNWEEGIELADEIIVSGKALNKMEELIFYSNSFS